MSISNILNIPADCLKQVMSFIDPKELAITSRVSKSWKESADDEAFYQEYLRVNYPRLSVMLHTKGKSLKKSHLIGGRDAIFTRVEKFYRENREGLIGYHKTKATCLRIYFPGRREYQIVARIEEVPASKNRESAKEIEEVAVFARRLPKYENTNFPADYLRVEDFEHIFFLGGCHSGPVHLKMTPLLPIRNWLEIKTKLSELTKKEGSLITSMREHTFFKDTDMQIAMSGIFLALITEAGRWSINALFY